jgi:hypothetical protein
MEALPGSESTTEDSGLSVSEGEQSTYNRWAGQGTARPNGTMDISSVSQSALAGESGDTSENERVSSDPLATVLAEWAVQVGFVSGEAGLVGLSDPSTSDTVTSRVHWVSGTRVFEGDYDPARVESAQQDATRLDDYHGYALYADDGTTVAISEETVLWARELSPFVSDATERVQAHIDAVGDEGARYATQHDGFADLQSALPIREYSGVVFDPDGGVLSGESNTEYAQIEDTDLASDVLGYAGSSTVDGTDLTASIAIRYPSADAVDDRETIESALGTEADRRGIEVDGPLVVVEGEYEDL